MSVAKMRMLWWVCGKIRKDKIRNEQICEMVRFTQIGDEMRERLRWYDTYNVGH